MAERVVSLPMYDFPECAAVTDAWWRGLACHFAAAGVAGVPAALSRPGEGREFWTRPDMLFSQACGYPLIASLSGRVTLLATPIYDSPGCNGADYCSFIVVQADSSWAEFSDLCGGACAVNGPDSWSGHHALRLLIAEEISEGADGFCRAAISGSHAASVKMVVEGRADFAAIDCVTHSILARFRPASLKGTRVLGRTRLMPGLPLIAGKSASPRDIEGLREGLQAAMADPTLASAREALGIAGVQFLPAGEYGRMAAALDAIAAAGVEPLV